MESGRKITVEIPAKLLEKAQLASGTGITQTVRAGIAARGCIARLRTAEANSGVRSGSSEPSLNSKRTDDCGWSARVGRLARGRRRYLAARPCAGGACRDS